MFGDSGSDALILADCWHILADCWHIFDCVGDHIAGDCIGVARVHIRSQGV